MKFVVGIGNPEKKYGPTRHNIGFRALDALRGAVETETKRRLVVSKEYLAEIAFVSDDALLVKPQTYVNRTGESVRLLCRQYQAKPADFLFVCDDVNLPLGALRLRGSGGAGGHHGLESAIEALGGEDFARLRIGVGGEGMPKDLSGYVLEDFGPKEEKELGRILDEVISVCRTWMDNGLKAATDRLSALKSNKQGSEEE